MSITVIALASGSSGNCTYVEAGGARLLFDAGISGAQAQNRLAQRGRDIRDVDAVIISHDHRDHASCAGVYHRKFSLPVYITKNTLQRAGSSGSLGAIADLRTFEAGGTLKFDGLSVQTIPTPHDAADGVVFVVGSDGRRLGIFTDLGHVFAGLGELMGTLDAVLLESNHDVEMLRAGPYPSWLKRRVRGVGGHLSNDEAAKLLAGCGCGLQWACLGHLSEKNNHPDVALDAHRRSVGRYLPISVAGRYEPTAPLTV
ncbi:MAG: MBL fold metallo-hydrolase [Pirellulaceae bacterium]